MQRSEEELRAGTREREVGQVRVNKQVRTDREQVRVLTRHEEVSVERVPVDEEDTGAGIGEDEVSTPVLLLCSIILCFREDIALGSSVNKGNPSPSSSHMLLASTSPTP